MTKCSASCALSQYLLNLSDDFYDPLLLGEDVLHELLGLHVLEVLPCVRVLEVQVTPVGKDLRGRYFPRALVLFAVVPPREAVRELLVLQRLRFAVVLAPLRQLLLVLPHVAGWTRAVEEEQVGWDAGVGREDAVRQAHDRV